MLSQFKKIMRLTRASHSRKSTHRRRPSPQLAVELLEERALLSTTVGDFYGDTFRDLDVGSPGKPICGFAGAGVVNNIYGSPASLNAAGSTFIHEASVSVPNAAPVNDHFGETMAVGDFNGDGIADPAGGVKN